MCAREKRNKLETEGVASKKAEIWLIPSYFVFSSFGKMELHAFWPTISNSLSLSSLTHAISLPTHDGLRLQNSRIKNGCACEVRVCANTSTGPKILPKTFQKWFCQHFVILWCPVLFEEIHAFVTLKRMFFSACAAIYKSQYPDYGCAFGLREMVRLSVCARVRVSVRETTSPAKKVHS